MKSEKRKTNKNYLLVLLLLVLSLPVIHESLYIIQDTFIKTPLYELKDKQFAKVNKEFDKFKINKSASVPKPLRLNTFAERGKNARKVLHLEFSKRRRPKWREQYKPLKMLGFGQYGTTFLSCVKHEDNCEYVIKCSRSFDLEGGDMRSPTAIGNELIVNETFALLDMAQGPDEIKKSVPVIYDFFSEVNSGCETFYMVSERFDKCFKSPSVLEKIAGRRGIGRWREELQKMRKGLVELLRKLNDYGWIHLDFHEDNILCRIEDGVIKYILIDWGLSFCVDDTVDPSHPVSMHYAVTNSLTGTKASKELSHLTPASIKNIQDATLDKWYKTVIDHSSFGSLEQKNRKFTA